MVVQGIAPHRNRRCHRAGVASGRSPQSKEGTLEGGEPVQFAGGRGMESEPCERDTDKHVHSSNSEPSINAARCVANVEATQGEGLGSLRSLPSPLRESSARHNPCRGCRPSRVPNRCGRLVSFVFMPRILPQQHPQQQR